MILTTMRFIYPEQHAGAKMVSGLRFRMPQRARLDYAFIAWFWLTMCSFTAIGVLHVFPVVHANSSVIMRGLHHVIVYFTFFEVVVNWLCIRLVNSTFNPADLVGSSDDGMLNGDSEINWNDLKEGSDGNYSVTVASNGGTRRTNGLTGRTMYVVEVTSDEPSVDDEGVCIDRRRRYVRPYWAWNACRPCLADRPPRAHHCPVCRACVLKRDHHCAFTGTCVGMRNQRHFVVFTFWVAIASFYSLAHALWYGFVDFLPRNSPYDLLLPVTVLRWGFDRTAAFDVVLVALFYSLVFFFFFSLYFFVSQITLVCEGLTSFESANGIRVKVSASAAENIRGVFGDYWLYNFILPLHHAFPCSDDGIAWPNVNV